MKDYNELEIILVLKKRIVLFSVSLVACLILGSFFVLNQKSKINQEYKKYQEEIKISQEQQGTIYIQIKKSKHAEIPENIINDAFDRLTKNNVIDDYRIYAQSPFFDTYVLFISNANREDKIKETLEILESNPVIIQLQENAKKFKESLPKLIKSAKTQDDEPQSSMDQQHIISAVDIADVGFFKIIESSYEPVAFLKNKAPINKHYIYLDKDRNAMGKGYNVSSTQIINAHQSLNTNKIWVFMILCAIMIALFITFSAESFKQIREGIRRIDN